MIDPCISILSFLQNSYISTIYNSLFTFILRRDCIPNVPCDTKLSKIKTLRLATSYIDYLINVLKSDDPKLAAEGFKADVHKKWNDKSDEQKRKELVSWEL